MGYGLDEDLEKRLELAGPSVRLNPRNAGAAPIAVVFTKFPGLHLRFGRWSKEPFPSCGCDACDESAQGEIERLSEMVEDVTRRQVSRGASTSADIVLGVCLVGGEDSGRPTGAASTSRVSC